METFGSGEHTMSTLKETQTPDAEFLPEIANNKKIWRNLRDAFPHPYTQDGHEQVCFKREHIF